MSGRLGSLAGPVPGLGCTLPGFRAVPSTSPAASATTRLLRPLFLDLLRPASLGLRHCVLTVFEFLDLYEDVLGIGRPSGGQRRSDNGSAKETQTAARCL